MSEERIYHHKSSNNVQHSTRQVLHYEMREESTQRRGSFGALGVVVDPHILDHGGVMGWGFWR